jgi:hypothetical protein
MLALPEWRRNDGFAEEDSENVNETDAVLF